MRSAGRLALCGLCALLVSTAAGCFLFGLGGGTTKRIPVRDYLTPKRSETGGYGLYSYVLLGAQPASDATRERYLRAMEAFLTIPTVSDAARAGRRPATLNLTYVLLNELPPSELAGCLDHQCESAKLKQTAEWIVDHYDYARAQFLLQAIEEDGLQWEGPYLLSQLKPLSTQGSVDEPFLYQDISKAPAHLVPAWIREFLAQAAREKFWEPKKVRSFALGLRQGIARLAEGVPDIVEHLGNWIKVFG